MRYRVAVELQRAHGGAPWAVVGVWLDGSAFWPIGTSRTVATRRQWEAGNARLEDLPTVIAPTIEAGALVALGMAGAWRRGEGET